MEPDLQQLNDYLVRICKLTAKLLHEACYCRNVDNAGRTVKVANMLDTYGGATSTYNKMLSKVGGRECEHLLSKFHGVVLFRSLPILIRQIFDTCRCDITNLIDNFIDNQEVTISLKDLYNISETTEE